MGRRIFQKHTQIRERRLQAELQFHLEQRTAENLASGMSEEEARRRALMEFQGLDRVKEECRQLHWEVWIESVYRDFRFAIRNLSKDSRFASLALLALALGIGSATVIFSALYGVLLNTFPFKDADQVTSFTIVDTAKPGTAREFLRLPEFLYFREHNHVFQDLSGEFGGFGTSPVRYSTGAGTYQFDADFLTVNSFDFFGVKPLLGRLPNENDVKPGATPVFVIGAKLWRQQFQSDAAIVGRSFTLNGVPTTLVGIMPARFRWAWVDAWLPFTLNRNEIENSPALKNQSVYTVGRLKPGVTYEQAAADLDVVAHQYAKIEPRLYPRQFTVTARSLADRVVGGFRRLIYPLTGAVALLLLIACANVANLLLARATAREREIAVRSALGATRARLCLQFLVEGLCLAAIGCAAGCFLAFAGIKALVPFVPYNAFPQEAVIELNPMVLLFSLGTAFISTLICGLAPALHAMRKDPRAGLNASRTGSTGGGSFGGLRSVLVVAEVGLTVVLLVGAGLMMRTFFAMTRADRGFNSNNILYAQMSFPRDVQQSARQQSVEFRRFVDRLKALPGVTAASPALTRPPLTALTTDINIPGKVHSEHWSAVGELCGEEYLDVLQFHILQGRFLSQADVDGARRVVVINEAFAHRYFGTENPIGQNVTFAVFNQIPDLKDGLFEIVGVSTNVRNRGFQNLPAPQAYFPYSLVPQPGTAFVARTGIKPESLVPSLRQLVWDVDPNAALVDASSLESWLKKYAYANSQFQFLVLGTFATIGLLLVLIGIFSVIAYTVAQQTHEIGIRMALGIPRGQIIRMVLGRGLIVITAGLVIGTAGSFAATRSIAHELVGVSPLDPWTYAAVFCMVVAAGMAACLSPARRAARVDPLEAIRCE